MASSNVHFYFDGSRYCAYCAFSGTRKTLRTEALETGVGGIWALKLCYFISIMRFLIMKGKQKILLFGIYALVYKKAYALFETML
jgi:hypothetical protein